jgi:hypothetical protein
MKKVVLSISAMLLVGTASYAQPGPVAGANSSLVGQTGTSQDAVVHQIGTSQSSKNYKRRKQQMMLLFIKGTSGQMFVSSANASAKNIF